ncbi:phospholipase D [Saccharata proteae CBS 121410]|uniref:Phospholipase D1 n=1 Tax=Saccharata proteae CBS 121410 TaxID=1314787 RepID=A0A6A5YE91_9PEZI|nr:phospholipase D [Saccharata proteae CBS 121410]
MRETRDSSVSPRSASPVLRSEPDAQNRTFSPLRIEQHWDGDGSLGITHMQEPQEERPTTSSSIKFEALAPGPKAANGFPFHAPNGTGGEVASNELNVPPTTNSLAPSPNFGQAADPSDFSARGQLSRNTTIEHGTSTPHGRRSVQFARSNGNIGEASHSRQQSWEDEDDVERRAKDRSSLIAKLKSLANPLQGHSRSISGFTIGDSIGEVTPTGPLSPESERSQPRFIDEDAEADDESAGEGPSRPAKSRRKSRRTDQEMQSAPTTPRAANLGYFARDSPGATPTSAIGLPRPGFAGRGTMSEIPENQRMGMSEDEGREALAQESAWRRGKGSRRRLSYSGRRQESSILENPESRRPSTFRRFTGKAKADGTADAASPSTWRQRGERTMTANAQKWRQLKAGLKMLGKQRKEQNRVDHAKSAELVAELLAGAPAALFFASMFQRDEHGHRKVPILLEQLKVRITDSQRVEGGDRHPVFRIELEYGSGMTRMKWVIHRTLGDFGKLHLKYRYQSRRIKKTQTRSGEETSKAKLPRFPKSVVPYLRGMRGFGDDDIDDEEEEEEPVAAHTDGEVSGADRPAKHKRRRSSFQFGRRKSSVGSPQPDTPGIVGEMTARTGSFFGAMPGAPTVHSRKDGYNERQRKKLELYLQKMITYLMFRPDSNRLCKFLELSALGVRLAQEGGYHGKEGFMMIQSSKGVDFRKGWAAIPIVKKHIPKWFLVRHSYIVAVDSPEEMNIYDVFLTDTDFRIDDKSGAKEMASKAKTSAAHPKHHQLRLVNSERKMKLLAKNERQLLQFQESIRFMAAATDWSKEHRFGSFAPVRHNVWAQWLVDGRDYMWNVSRAISMARDVIYIHDWWLSPELYMRRPPAISQKWRLDRLLQRKAQEGVKVFVIMYRNINSAIPIDSEYTKFSLLDLHPNVFVQRSPNQIKQNQFFWAHHEKICIVDHTVAFCGGVDLCFGRWDTPKHVLTDDKLTGFELDNDLPKDADHCQMWPGKDYSNPRVHDFYDLAKPYEEMYDREKVPRMPWHDIGMQIVGQPARDLTRHFVQRWNYLRRSKKPTRPTPFLLPPPDFNPADLQALGLDGTCEIQMLRSACRWSLGTQDRTEHSIMNAYVKSIQTSEHFVYIENQFYISSCDVEGTKILNQINEALLERIKRAHKNQEDWRCVLVIPLMPGFQNTVDSQDGTSVRLIMTCQYRSICRGESSLFERLRASGIDPEDYIQFYSLRSWGKIGPTKSLVTEQLYIHAKCMIVDDRIVIIGSANINERSMLGSRDSEVAAIVRDAEMIPSFMAGKPYMVAKFAHTLRVRLMREHLGIDIDEMLEEEQQAASDVFESDLSRPSSPESNPAIEEQLIKNKMNAEDELIAKAEGMHSFNHDSDWLQEHNPNLHMSHGLTADPRVTNNPDHERDVRGEGPDHMREALSRGTSRGRDSTLSSHAHEYLLSDVATEGRGSLEAPKKSSPKKSRERSNTSRTRTSVGSALDISYAGLPPPMLPRMDTRALGLTQLSQLPPLPVCDDTDIGGPPLQRAFTSNNWLHSLLADMRRPVVTPDCMIDPLNDSFYVDTWNAVATNNTRLFRQVFRCMPDNEVRTWKEYREYAAFAERFQKAQGGAGKSETRRQQESESSAGGTGPPGHSANVINEKLGGAGRFATSVGGKVVDHVTPHSNHPMGEVSQWAEDQEKTETATDYSKPDTPPMDEKDALRQSDLRNPSPLGIDGANESVITDTSQAPRNAAQETMARYGSQRERTIMISEPTTNSGVNGSQKRRKRAATKSSTKTFSAMDDNALLSKEDAEQVLNLVQGHLVQWPYDWLEKEESGGGWLYAVDQIAPLEI